MSVVVADGGLSKTGTGSMVLSNANTYSGGTLGGSGAIAGPAPSSPVAP